MRMTREEILKRNRSTQVMSLFKDIIEYLNEQDTGFKFSLSKSLRPTSVIVHLKYEFKIGTQKGILAAWHVKEQELFLLDLYSSPSTEYIRTLWDKVCSEAPYVQDLLDAVENIRPSSMDAKILEAVQQQYWECFDAVNTR